MAEIKELIAESKRQQSKEQRVLLEQALRYYVRNHLKPGDLEEIPELRQFI